MRPALIAPVLAAAMLAIVPTVAQMPKEAPGKLDPSRVTAGTYKIETNHTQVRFGVDHLGFNPYFGVFSGATGTLVLDPTKPNAAKLDVSVPVASIQTTSDKLTEELKDAKWLDAAKFPTMRFVSTGVTVNGNTATIRGNLTLHGVTKPVVLEAKFTGAGPSMMSKTTTVGFTGTTEIRRSDFGVASYVPLVSDAVSIEITAAFEK